MKKLIRKKVVLPILALLFLGITSSFKSDLFEIAKQIEIFTTLFKELQKNYVDETNPAALMNSAIKSMLKELDPYTQFLNEQDVETYKIRNKGEYSGIGALIRTYKEKLLIVELYQGYAADKAGLKAGDAIIKIDDIDVADFDDSAIELLKGAKNTSVNITFVRQGETHTATLAREGIEVDAVPFYDMLDEKTGYIVLSQFNKKASSQTKSALHDLKGRGAKSLILDLRGNPGGLLSEAINVTNLFVPKGELIVTTKSKVKKFNDEYRTKKKPEDVTLPLVVLIDGKSASASEIVSGGLQDLDRAVIMGARSFGKGLVQRPIQLVYGTQLKVTISRYYTPSGRCIQSLDYRNRDAEGKAVRNIRFKEFTTKKGRTVWDGGGILPDVEIAALQSNALLDTLRARNLIFDFATSFYYQHTFTTLDAFVFSDVDFDNFTDFVQTQDVVFQTETEKLLEQALNTDSPLLGPEVQEKYNDFLAAMSPGKIAALDTYKKEIRKMLEDEIIKRYFYRKGLYTYYLKHDEAILAAKALLHNKAKYNAILN